MQGRLYTYNLHATRKPIDRAIYIFWVMLLRKLLTIMNRSSCANIIKNLHALKINTKINEELWQALEVVLRTSSSIQSSLKKCSAYHSPVFRKGTDRRLSKPPSLTRPKPQVQKMIRHGRHYSRTLKSTV